MRTILLTGASKGLGLTIAKQLCKINNYVIVVNRSISTELLELQKEYPANMKIIQFDLLDSESIKDKLFVEKIGLRTKIDALINNAAFAYDDIVTNLNLKKLQQMYNVNVFSPMILTKYCIRSMLLHKTGGSIIHLSSISVHTGYKGLAMYASTKGALEAFSKNTAREWGSKGIKSNCIVAGFMETSMSSSLNTDQKNRIYNRTSIKKPTSIDSVASTILFLLSDNSESITGQNVFVDNGTI